MSDCVELRTTGPVGVLRLNRPPINALDETALHQLMTTFDQIDDDPAVRVVIIVSAVRGVFCAGGDLKYWPVKYPDQPGLVSKSGRRTFDRIEHLRKPSIAVIDGHVIGDGLSFALACDIRFASLEATFILPEIDYGFIPGWGTVNRLVKVVGLAAATELLVLGETIEVARALEMGLVNKVLPATDLMSSVESLALRLAAKPPMAMQYAKAALHGQSSHRLSSETDWEERCFRAVWGGEEWQQGIRGLFGGKNDMKQESCDEERGGKRQML